MVVNHSPTNPVIIIGGGVIGLSIGWQLLRKKIAVVIIEKGQCGRAASWAAAGMLAPHSEVGFEQVESLRPATESLKLYPRFLEELAEDSDIRITLGNGGTLIVALDQDDNENNRRLFDFRQQLGLPVEWLTGAAARELEPLLSPKTIGGIWLPDDSEVNNRRLVDALKTAVLKCGGVIHEGLAVESVSIHDGIADGVVTSGDHISASAVVVAAGCWSKDLRGIPEDHRPRVRPVKGQIVSLRSQASFELTRVIRAPGAYIIPKDDGRVVVGASQEEMGFDVSPTAGPVMDLLVHAWEAVPSIYDLPIESIEVGLRPGSRDAEPIIGATQIAKLYYATGHFRQGILLAPLTAYAIRDLLIDDEMNPVLSVFTPSRFRGLDSVPPKGS